MDEQRFDDALRSFGTRRAFGLGTVGALLIAVTRAPEADAKGKKGKNNSKKNGKKGGKSAKNVNSETNTCLDQGECCYDNANSCCTKVCFKRNQEFAECTCLSDGDTCDASVNCCSGTCVNGKCSNHCGGENATCDKDDCCCDGLTCQSGHCKPPVCVPQCSGVVCGPDGCGGQCGPACTNGCTCSPLGQCDATCPDHCVELGGTCSSTSDCCGDRECRGGICRFNSSECKGKRTMTDPGAAERCCGTMDVKSCPGANNGQDNKHCGACPKIRRNGKNGGKRHGNRHHRKN